jgi:hypothetical protein
LLSGAALAIVPATWTIGNYRASGDPLYGVTMALQGAPMEEAGPVALQVALRIVADRTVAEFGWVLTGAAMIGALLAHRRRLSTDPWRFLLALSIVAWTFLVAFTTRRGVSMQPRYFLSALVLALPFAALGLAEMARHRRTVAASALFGILAMAVIPAWRSPWRYLIARTPPEIDDLVAWLRDSPYADRNMVLTALDWKASYFAVEWPETIAREHIVSPWTTEAELHAMLEGPRPALVITADRDADQRARIELALGRSLPTDPITSFGEVRVYNAEPMEASTE